MATTPNGLFDHAEAKACIVHSSDSICTALVKMIRCYVLIYRYEKYRYTSAGKISDKFCSEIKTCVANTPTTP